jgi:transcriptional regulator with XRE-family HTH domain
VKFKRIKDLREDNDKLQKEIANLLGISQQYYSEYEKGNRTITINHLITLAKYYGTSIDYIVGLSNEKNFLKQNNNKKTS